MNEISSELNKVSKILFATVKNMHPVHNLVDIVASEQGIIGYVVKDYYVLEIVSETKRSYKTIYNSYISKNDDAVFFKPEEYEKAKKLSIEIGKLNIEYSRDKEQLEKKMG